MIRVRRNKWHIIQSLQLHPVDLITSPAITSRKKGQEGSWGHNWKQMSHWKSFSGLQLRIWNSWDPNYWGCVAGRREWGMKLGKLLPKDSFGSQAVKLYMHLKQKKNPSFPVCICLLKGKGRAADLWMLPCYNWIWNLCPWLKWGTQLHQSLIITDKPK